MPFLPPNQQRQSTDGTNIEGTFKDLQKKLDERERERSLDSAAQESVKVVHGAVCVCDTVTWLGRVLASLDHDAVSSRLRSLKWTAAGANSLTMSI